MAQPIRPRRVCSRLTRVREKECTMPPGLTSNSAVLAPSPAPPSASGRTAASSASQSRPLLSPLGAAILARKPPYGTPEGSIQNAVEAARGKGRGRFSGHLGDGQ